MLHIALNFSGLCLFPYNYRLGTLIQKEPKLSEMEMNKFANNIDDVVNIGNKILKAYGKNIF